MQPRGDGIFIQRAFAHASDKAMPVAEILDSSQGIGGLVPAVEIADDGNFFGIGGPDGEIGSFLFTA